jgi:hypothetical protein
VGAQAAVSAPGDAPQGHAVVGTVPVTPSTVATSTTTTTTASPPAPAAGTAAPVLTSTPTSTPAPAAAPAAAPPPTAVPTAAPASTAAPAPAPAAAPAPAPPPTVPAYGQATTWGCAAALAYLEAYAAPGFAFDCPGYAEGHEAMTCVADTPQFPDACPSGPTIAISDACPQAYMNETANSWNLTGQLAVEQQRYGISYGSIDPFGACP